MFDTIWRFKESWSSAIDEINMLIEHHGMDHINDGRGIWTYYVFLHESKLTTPVFDKFWLPDKFEAWADPTLQPRLTHDWYALPEMDFRGGVTFYDKICAVPGHRCVKIGCDLNHLWDEGVTYDLQTVASYAEKTAKSVCQVLKELKGNKDAK